MQRYVWETPEEINIDVAKNLRVLRKRKGISQQELSRLSGVSYGSIKRFESTGNISFLSLTRLAAALDAVDQIKALFTNVAYQSIEEVINEQKYR
jgi:transcriptional regulator with XRE-family HTH domain